MVLLLLLLIILHDYTNNAHFYKLIGSLFNYKTINFNFYKFRTIAFATIAISQHQKS